MNLFDPFTLGRFFFFFDIISFLVPVPPSNLCYSLRVNHHQPNITVPYAEILAAAARYYSVYDNDDDNASIDTAKSNAPYSATPNTAKRFLSTSSRAALMSNGGKQSLSTLAGRLVANNGVFHNGNKRRQPLSTLAQLPSAPAIGHAFKGRIVSGAFQRTLDTSISRRGTSLIMSPADAVIAPWGRLLARLPRKW